jgi:glyoxylase-like metal-dependent hydrolase (beta-lactamase superfamily II)
MGRKLILLLPLVVSGCATSSKLMEPSKDGTVSMMRQGSAGSFANVYWFETPSGPVIVDVPLTTTEGQRLRDSIAHPYRIYITAARPERYGSLDTVRQGEVPAHTTPAIATEIQSYGASRLAPYAKEYGKLVPSSVTPPLPAIEERTNDMVGEVEVELIPLGPAANESSLAIFLPKTRELLTGDVVTNGEHMDLTWGRSVVWQDRINELKALEPKIVYPGHGKPGGPELLDEAMTYLKFFHDTVAEKVKPGAPAKITRSDLEDVKRKMRARFPKHGREDLLEKSIPAEYAVQLSTVPAPTPETPAAPAGGAAPATGAAPTATPAPATAAPATAASAAKPADAKKSSSENDELLNATSPGGGKKKKGKK